MKLHIRHQTQYDFDAPVPFGLQQLRKTPKSFRNQNIVSWSTEVTGGRKELSFEDYHRNTVELISFEANTQSITLTSEGVVIVEDTNGVLDKKGNVKVSETIHGEDIENHFIPSYTVQE